MRTPLPFVLVALALLWLAERSLTETPRVVALALASLAGLTALTLAGLRLRRAETRRMGLWTLAAYALVGAGLAVYAFVDVAPERRGFINVVWPALVVLGLLPAWAMEVALGSMKNARVKESWRVSYAARSALIVALAMVAFAGVNYAASVWNRKIDVSYLKTTIASDATKNLVAQLATEAEVVMFYPPGNEVAEELWRYFEPLAGGKLSVRRVDQALEPELAKELKVRANGQVVFRANDRSEALSVGLDMEDARKTLRKLDGEVHERLLKVGRAPLVAYLTTGHGERDFSPAASDKRFGLSDFKALADSLGYTVRRLGVAEGLSQAVPSDASVVIVAGPTEPFLPEELTTLTSYVTGGGRLWLLLDPEHGGADLSPLLQVLGIEKTTNLVASDKQAVSVMGRGSSPFNFAATRTSTHPSMTTLSQNPGRVAVVLLGAAALRKREDAPKNAKITMTLRTSGDAWLDDGDAVFEEKTETREVLDLMAAVELAQEGQEKPGRALVVADADVVGSGILRNPSNAYVVLDGLKWLGGEEAIAGKIESEEDVPLVHKKEDDAVWFYGVSFLMPALVLALGAVVNRKRVRGA